MRTALVLGGGATIHADIAAYTGPYDGVVACNDFGAEWKGELDAWVSFHPAYWHRKKWIANRLANGNKPAKQLFAQKLAVGVRQPITVTDYRFPEQVNGGSSGLFACKVALIDLGYDRAVLCGIPMEVIPHFYDDKPWRTASVMDFRRGWLEVPEEYRNRMKSMSGWTRTLLGAPDGIDS